MSLAQLNGYLPPFTAPTHPLLPFGALDLFGAARLSMVINWIASGAFDPPAPVNEKRKKGPKARASILQELFGLMVVVFGGETFLCELHSGAKVMATDERHVYRHDAFVAHRPQARALVRRNS